jgi:hypothetical protein
VRIESEPGDPVGGGQIQILTNGSFSVSASASSVSVDYFDRGHTWTFAFAAPAGETLVPGAYVEAEDGPFQGPAKPALRASGVSTCSGSTGRFVVLELVKDAAGQVTSSRSWTAHGSGAS